MSKIYELWYILHFVIIYVYSRWLWFLFRPCPVYITNVWITHLFYISLYYTHTFNQSLFIFAVKRKCKKQGFKKNGVSCVIKEGRCKKYRNCKTNESLKTCHSYYECTSDKVPRGRTRVTKHSFCKSGKVFVKELSTCLSITPGKGKI